MKKIKKSTGITLALFLYISGTAVYLLPRNHEISLTEKCITIAFAYLILIVLWFVLRKKEQMQQRRREQEQIGKLNK